MNEWHNIVEVDYYAKKKKWIISVEFTLCEQAFISSSVGEEL